MSLLLGRLSFTVALILSVLAPVAFSPNWTEIGTISSILIGGFAMAWRLGGLESAVRGLTERVKDLEDRFNEQQDRRNS